MPAGTATLELPQWPRALPALGSAICKAAPEDFQVQELAPSAEITGRSDEDSGLAHQLFLIEKTALNSLAIVSLLARWAGVPRTEVGYAGRKDRLAVTQQWFSVPAAPLRRRSNPGAEFEQFAQAHIPENASVRVCGQAWQPRKLRVGELAGNAFSLRLYLAQGVPEALLESALVQLQRCGVPNYFGQQRFGHDNLASAVRWLASRAGERERGRQPGPRRRRRQPGSNPGWQLSTLRAFLFNQVLAQRVRRGDYARPVEGEVQENGVPTGPLWGRGRNPASGLAAQLEREALEPYADLLDGLEHAGARQMRRALVVYPQDLNWRVAGTRTVELQFSLAAGAYATVLLDQLFCLQEGIACSARGAAEATIGATP